MNVLLNFFVAFCLLAISVFVPIDCRSLPENDYSSSLNTKVERGNKPDNGPEHQFCKGNRMNIFTQANMLVSATVEGCTLFNCNSPCASYCWPDACSGCSMIAEYEETEDGKRKLELLLEARDKYYNKYCENCANYPQGAVVCSLCQLAEPLINHLAGIEHLAHCIMGEAHICGSQPCSTAERTAIGYACQRNHDHAMVSSTTHLLLAQECCDKIAKDNSKGADHWYSPRSMGAVANADCSGGTEIVCGDVENCLPCWAYAYRPKLEIADVDDCNFKFFSSKNQKCSCCSGEPVCEVCNKKEIFIF